MLIKHVTVTGIHLMIFFLAAAFFLTHTLPCAPQNNTTEWYSIFNKNAQVHSLLMQSRANQKKFCSCRNWRCYMRGKLVREKLGLQHLCFGDIFVIQLQFLNFCSQVVLYKIIVWYYWTLKTLLFVMSYENIELFWLTENVCLLNKHFTLYCCQNLNYKFLLKGFASSSLWFVF